MLTPTISRSKICRFNQTIRSNTPGYLIFSDVGMLRIISLYYPLFLWYVSANRIRNVNNHIGFRLRAYSEVCSVLLIIFDEFSLLSDETMHRFLQDLTVAYR